MASDRRALRSSRVVGEGGVAAADVVMEGERIVAVEPPRRRRSEVEDLGDLVLMPGLVDAHVHVNEPGRTEWEGFAHATRAAAAGGTTTIADMPLNSDPVTTTVAALDAKRAAARGQCWVDVGFHAGLVPDNARRADVLRALDRKGVLAWKAFLCDSGIPEFAPVAGADLAAAMPLLASSGARLLAHAEIADAASGAAVRVERHRDWEASRPPAWECRAIELLVSLCRATGCAVHVVHLSTAAALPLIRRARNERLPFTVETCPHYLHFALEDLPDGDARFKCAPPIRGRDNRDALWGALADGTIDLVASDHSPCPPDLKTRGGGDLAAAWGGIASLQLTLPVVWTGARARGLGVERVADWLCRRPAALLGLDGDRGAIVAGRLASLVAWDPEASFVVDPARLAHRHPTTTPYAGERLHGVVERTWLRGREVARRGEIVGRPHGRLLTRPGGRAAPAAAGGGGLGGTAPRPRGASDPAAGSAAIDVAALGQASQTALRDLLTRCCAARAWVDAMIGSIVAASADPVASSAADPGQPTPSEPPADLAALADRSFDRLRREDWLEAFAGHPRIGDLSSLRHRFAATADLAAAEQAGTREASDRVLRALAQSNADYERRFGHVFIVCATGKSADEMLRLLRQRLVNDPSVELEIAAAEQRKITHLRLAALVADTAEDG